VELLTLPTGPLQICRTTRNPKFLPNICHWWGINCCYHLATECRARPDRRSSPGQQKQEIVRPANAKTAVYSSGSGPYYIEFRSRFAWDYGHTYIVHGQVGETPTRASVAGLSPVGDDATAWVVGHYVPVPAETGWTDGDLEDKYVTARYRVLVSKEQYDRIMAHVRELQSRSKMWSAELYNCNAFVADIATFMGLKVPSSTLIYPKIFVNNLRKINTGHPEAADRLISDNVKEMSSSTRDGRAMIVSNRARRSHFHSERHDRCRSRIKQSGESGRHIGPLSLTANEPCEYQASA
jgi:hypothetical protein